MDNRPIGIMDSGVGGLTVARALAARYPQEGILFTGDTGHNPYGSRSAADIERLASRMKDFLLAQDVKLIIIACNTISFNVGDSFLTAPVPVVKMSMDVPFPKTAQKVGIFATPATIAVHAHKRYLEKKFPGLTFVEIPVDKAAAAIEQGRSSAEIAGYISHAVEMAGAGDIDTGLWACTHYPLVPEAFQAVLPGVPFLDPAAATVEKGMNLLRAQDGLAGESGERRFYFTASTVHAAPLVRSLFGNVPVEETDLSLAERKA